MTDEIYDALSRLERRIMDVVYRLGEAPATVVASELGDEDAYDSIRVTMAKLEKKDILTHRKEGNRNVYRPTVPGGRARASAVEHLLHTFFDGSPSSAILQLLDSAEDSLSDAEIEEIRERIRDVSKSQDKG